jgi:hypothetical protein
VQNVVQDFRLDRQTREIMDGRPQKWEEISLPVGVFLVRAGCARGQAAPSGARTMSKPVSFKVFEKLLKILNKKSNFLQKTKSWILPENLNNKNPQGIFCFW